MKLKIIGMLAGLGLLLPSASALAHTDVRVDLGFGIPAPPAVYVEEHPYYYDDYDYAPRVYYRGYYGWYPRHYYYAPRYYGHSTWRDHDWDDRRGHAHDRGDRGGHRGHHR